MRVRVNGALSLARSYSVLYHIQALSHFDSRALGGIVRRFIGTCKHQDVFPIQAFCHHRPINRIEFFFQYLETIKKPKM